MTPITSDEYRTRILAALTPTELMQATLTDARGLVLAVDLHAREQIPPFANSAMDGYAVVAADVATATAATPVRLPVVDDIPAGRTDALTLRPGQVMRIMTGAPMPAGSDAVVPVEATDAATDTVQIIETRDAGAHVRGAGDDVAVGDLVLAAHTRLTARHIAAAAASGHAMLPVHRRPRVAIISTGSELRTAGEPLAFGQIPDSNSHLLAVAAAEVGAEVVFRGAVSDDPAQLRALLDQVSPTVDAIVLSGGVSVGAYDVVKEVLAPLPSMWFGPVAMQPGKPQGSGHLADGTAVFALPGNPVSGFVSFEVFVRPALARLAGQVDVEPRFVPARAAVSWASPPGREQFMPVRAEHDGITPLVHPASRRGSGSHLVGGLAAADGLARIPAVTTEVIAGQTIDYLEATR